MKVRGKLASHQFGLSLIELMVALTLGLMITVSLGYILMGSRSTYRTQDASARVQDTGRFALEFIGRQLRMAGRADITPLASDPLVELGVDAITADSTATQMTVQYQDDADCNGFGVVGTVVNVISLDASRQLQCDGNGGSTQPFAEEVEELQFRYTTGGGTWTTVPVSPVVAVEVCVRVRSLANGIVNTTQTLKNCAGADFTPDPVDTRLRRTFTSVFALRNNINALPMP